MTDQKKTGKKERKAVDLDFEKIDAMVLALLKLTTCEEQEFDGRIVRRAWKGHDWDALNRLHEKGLIDDPKNKNKSVVLTPEGVELSEKFFAEFCLKKADRAETDRLKVLRELQKDAQDKDMGY